MPRVTNRKYLRLSSILLFSLAALLVSACAGGGTPADAAPAAESTEAGSELPLTEGLLEGGQIPMEGIDTTDGQALFVSYCAKCHGLEGRGDGPSVGSLATPLGMDLTTVGEKSGEELLATISNGKGIEMPAWGLILTLEQRQALVDYVRTLGGS